MLFTEETLASSMGVCNGGCSVKFTKGITPHAPDPGVQPSSGGCWVRRRAVGAAAWRKGSTAPRPRGRHMWPLPWGVDLPATVPSTASLPY